MIMSQQMERNYVDDVERSMLGLTLNAASPTPSSNSNPTPPPAQTVSTATTTTAMPAPTTMGANGSLPALTADLPTISNLQQAAPFITSPSTPLESKAAWIRDVLFLVSRATSASSSTPSSSSSPTSTTTELASGPVILDEPELASLAERAVQLIIEIVPNVPSSSESKARMSMVSNSSMSSSFKAEAEVLYWRGTLTVSGAFPKYLPQNPRAAFRTFEAAARAGHHAAWFRLGRDYEAFNDGHRARTMFERGVKAGEVSSLYRMGMAHLMGQLGLPISYDTAIPLLHRAADKATMQVPQPAYVYALLMLDDFAHTNASIPRAKFEAYVPVESNLELEAQKYLERAAYLHFVPAQYKIGHSYEFARPPFAYDPLLSVQYYTLASSAGEAEADLALSKWFLCGAEGVFEKDESLAFVFAERAARMGLASAEFAMGYYWEVGIGTPAGTQDLKRARKWYEKASAQGNTDALDRLSTLKLTPTASISRNDHAALAEQTLVRRRTQAKQRSDAAGSIRRTGPRDGVDQVVGVARRASRIQRPGAGRRRIVSGSGSGSGSGGEESINGNRMTEKRTSLAPTVESPRLMPVMDGQTGQYTSTVPSPPPASSSASTVTASSGSGSGYKIPSPEWNSEGQRTSPSPAPASSPEPIQQRQFREKTRYSLVDPGASSSRPTSRVASPSPLRSEVAGSSPPPGHPGFTTRGRNPSSGMQAGEASNELGLNGSSVGGGGKQERGQSKVKYNTFEEMGIQGKKMPEDKDCVIM